MQVQSFNFEDFKPEIYNFVKETVEEILGKEKEKKVEISNYELLERIVKVEEELKHQRELIQILINQIERRFEQVDKRFEQIDKRFEQIDKRFEQITSRIDRFMIWSLGLVMSSTALIIGYMHYFR